jgi:hypothetical protein
MRHGAEMETLLKIEAGGFPVPQLEERPSVTGFQWLWEAFIHLSSCRDIGMVAGPIPWTAIHTYAEYLELSKLDEYILSEVIMSLDAVWRDEGDRKREAQRNTKQPGTRH